MPDAYHAALEYLFGRLNYERVGMPRGTAELRLGRMRRLLKKLGDPHFGPKIVHVAGTKGKGSTSAMIAAALSASGRRVGLFCSPHLHRLEERFRVDGVEATSEELIDLVDAVRPAVDALDGGGDRHYRHRGSTFFEVTAAMGLLHFARREVDVVVLEVGMGGRLDSTNVVRPSVSVLTTISFDHTRQLGTTLGAIAGEKAGIIKRGRPVVSGVLGDEARGVIARVAWQRNAPLRSISDDFNFRYEPPSTPLVRPTPGRVAVRTWHTDWGTFDLPLLGPHQAHNAAVALASLDALAEQGMATHPDAVAQGFAAMSWPARVEVVAERPWIVIDGAHNVASAEALAESLHVCFPPTSRTLVFGTTREKDLDGQLRALLPLADVVVATRYADNPRAVPPDEVAHAVALLGGPPAHIAPGPAEALALARELTNADGLILVTGSLFLAAESRSLVLDQAAGSARETPIILPGVSP